MQKQTLNGSIRRLDYKDGNFVQLSKKILTDKNLTDPALRLLMLLVDTPPTSKISLTYYKKLLEWSNDKLSGATDNLTANGYLQITQHPKGTKGFLYTYEVSENGDLVPDIDADGKMIKIKNSVKPHSKKSKSEVEEIIQSETMDPISEPEEEVIQPEVIEIEPKADPINLRDYSPIISKFITDEIDDETINKILDYFENAIATGKLYSPSQMTEANIQLIVERFIPKVDTDALIKEVCLNHAGGRDITNENKKEITNKIINYFKRNPDTIITERSIRNKILLYKTEYSKYHLQDQRYQN